MLKRKEPVTIFIIFDLEKLATHTSSDSFIATFYDICPSLWIFCLLHLYFRTCAAYIGFQQLTFSIVPHALTKVVVFILLNTFSRVIRFTFEKISEVN